MIEQNNRYFKQVELLIRILPFISKEPCFAIKGGTAINLFIRDLPRLSVDIDLVYLPVQDRNTSLGVIDNALQNIAEHAKSAIEGLVVSPSFSGNTGKIIKLMIAFGGTRVKIEVNPVMRGTLFPSETLPVRGKISNMIGYAECQIISFSELYAGKICAALDRQHPRDLFDIQKLLENEGLNKAIFKAFLVYLISHNRPISELLMPNLKDISSVYNREFSGMTFDNVSIEELYKTRKNLIDIIHDNFQEKDKKFLITFKSGIPDWELLGIKIAQKLPAVNWKLQNIRNMTEKKRTKAILKLEKALNI